MGGDHKISEELFVGDHKIPGGPLLYIKVSEKPMFRQKNSFINKQRFKLDICNKYCTFAPTPRNNGNVQ